MTTRINVAMERLALIAALVLPVSAVSGIYGMNLIVNEHTQPRQVAVVLALMLGVVFAMLMWPNATTGGEPHAGRTPPSR